MMSAPKLRFKAFDGDWILDDIGKFLIEYKEKVPSSTEIEIFSSSRDGLKPQKEYFDNRELQNLGEYGVVPPNYFTYRHMSDDTTFKFNINSTGNRIAVSKEYPVFTTNKDLDSQFLLLKLNESNDFKKFAIEQKKGGTRTRLYFKALSTWEALIPSKKEQTKIATFLSSVDEKIAQLSKKQRLLSQYKQGMMQKLFSQQIRFKADDGSAFGEWENKKLGDICAHFQSGKTITSASISEVGDYPVYGGNGLRGFTDSYTHEGVFALIGRQGALCGNINLVNGKTFISEHAIAVQTNINSSTEWLSRWLDFMKLNRFSESSAQAGLAVNKLVKFDIAVPCLEEQTKIANFLSAIDQKIEVVTQQIEQAKTWKKGLLQQMFV